MLFVEYNSREVWKRLISFQIIPIIAVLYGIGVSNKMLAVRSNTGISVAIAVGCIIYGIMMAFMVNALRHPVILSIGDDRILKWRPVFKVFEKRIPAGTRVTFASERVIISPRITELPGSQSTGQSTIISLPKGLKEVAHGTFIIP